MATSTALKSPERDVFPFSATSKQVEIEYIASLLAAEEVIWPHDAGYAAESKTWSTSKDLHPQLVVRPTTVESLSTVLKALSTSILDFAVRCQGFGSTSANDVLISSTAFDSFEWDPTNEVVYLGAGQTWRNYYEAMEKAAPEYTVVAARTPGVGVAGSILSGGFSWMSGEYGCMSDSANMLDAQVVKLDGSIVWASEEPDLLWALRGAYVGVGVVTKFKLRAYRYTTKIFAGPIFIPRKAVPQIAKSLAALDSAEVDPKVSMFVYPVPKPMMKFAGVETDEKMVAVHAYDARGWAVGRNQFKWALEIEGAIDRTSETNIRGASKLLDGADFMKGKTQEWWNPISMHRLTEQRFLKAYEWWSRVESTEGVNGCGYMLFEVFCTTPKSDPGPASAWPRQNFKHMILCGVGCMPDAPVYAAESAKQLVQEAPEAIFGDEFEDKTICPNGLEQWHNLAAIYGPHWQRILSIKRRCDPENRFRGLIHVE